MTKYISKIAKGNDTIYIKDSDARDAIGYSAEFVDLGLPSGTLWAKCNVGASTETGYGNYYMYGKGTRQYDYEDNMYEGMENPLSASVDTATQVIGSPWHTPTSTQMRELLNNTVQTKETNFNSSGINGYKFTSKVDNTKYIFLPFAGFCYAEEPDYQNSWFSYGSSTPSDDNAVVMQGSSSDILVSSTARVRGNTIRPVCESAPLKPVSDKADKVKNATNGNFAGLDANGNLTDSGKSTSDFAAADHTHTDKADKVSGATSNNFAGLDSNGNLIDSGSNSSTFAAANHTHTNKADKVSGATNNNLAALNSNGNLKDSGYAPSDFASASDLTDEITRATEAEEALAELYQALTQSDIVVTDTLPASGEANTIYRVPDSEYESYSDYMYYNNAWKLMATYTTPMDHVPTEDSLNLVFSGGVYEWGAEAAEIVADPAGDWDPGTAEEYFEQIQQEVALLTTIVQSTQLEIGAVQLDLVPTENSGNFVNSGGIYTALTGKYNVQPNGIPSTDMSSAVQASLTLADNSAQIGEVVATVG